MTPVFYCGMRHMPCKRLPTRTPIPDVGPWGPHLFQPVAVADYFDYVLMRSPPGRPLFGAAHARYELIARNGSWLAYRTLKAPGSAPAATASTGPAAPAAPPPAPARGPAPAAAPSKPVKVPAARRAGRAIKSAAAQGTRAGGDGSP
jgi:hypothetical protein